MYVCVHVHVYVYVCVYVCVYVHVLYLHVHVCACAYVLAFVCVKCEHVCIQVHMHVHGLHYIIPSFITGHYTHEMIQDVLGGAQISVHLCGQGRNTLQEGARDCVHYTNSVVGGISDLK